MCVLLFVLILFLILNGVVFEVLRIDNFCIFNLIFFVGKLLLVCFCVVIILLIFIINLLWRFFVVVIIEVDIFLGLIINCMIFLWLWRLIKIRFLRLWWWLIYFFKVIDVFMCLLWICLVYILCFICFFYLKYLF